MLWASASRFIDGKNSGGRPERNDPSLLLSIKKFETAVWWWKIQNLSNSDKLFTAVVSTNKILFIFSIDYQLTFFGILLAQVYI
jgi:hypothetical protein